MMKVLINDIEYVPKAEAPRLDDHRVLECLHALVGFKYFNEPHKANNYIYDAIHAIAPEYNEMDVDVAYQSICR